ncbi:hypothetical protein AB834_00550 [PVC group bacterium (ex Bugula neritina AB1)]|nr:hypothetical protein AB834_00550 [PVC group bacterium (ex Bugula neritina AB1)]
MKKIAIIGAGISGLSLAHLLKDHAEMTFFEKSRGVSGRMSTRYAEPYFFDHGAQYFTVRTQTFQSFIEPLIERGLIRSWTPRYVKFDGEKIVEFTKWTNKFPHYVGVPRMNQIVQYLSEGFNIFTHTKIKDLKRNDKWQLLNDKGKLYDDFDWVISTIPSPQAVDLFPKFFKYYVDIKKIKMRPCFSVMLGFKNSVSLGFEAAHLINSDLSWIAVNSHKPGRNNNYTLLIHSSHEYAEKYLESDREDVLNHLLNISSRITKYDMHLAEHKALHAWHYANSETGVDEDFFIDQESHLGICADWCMGSRVEGAFTSAFYLSNKLKKELC